MIDKAAIYFVPFACKNKKHLYTPVPEVIFERGGINPVDEEKKIVLDWYGKDSSEYGNIISANNESNMADNTIGFNIDPGNAKNEDLISDDWFGIKRPSGDSGKIVLMSAPAMRSLVRSGPNRKKAKII